MALYPLPSVLALVGWVYVYESSGQKAIVLSLVWIALGILAFLSWARIERTWPFGDKEISEQYMVAPETAGHRS
jgi:hypothetical protein